MTRKTANAEGWLKKTASRLGVSKEDVIEAVRDGVRIDELDNLTKARDFRAAVLSKQCRVGIQDVFPMGGYRKPSPAS